MTRRRRHQKARTTPADPERRAGELRDAGDPSFDEEVTVYDLVGVSEDSYRWAEGGEYRMGTHGRVPRREALSLAPEDLGRHALEEATQDSSFSEDE